MFKINNVNFALFLIERYNSPWSKGNPSLVSKAGSIEHEHEYALLQLQNKTISGFGEKVLDKNILEIGCGHGGISIFAVMNGAKKVVGIDLSDEALAIANSLKMKFIEKGLVREDKIEFQKVFAEDLPFPEDSFDLVIADNVFEHVTDLEQTLNECKKVMKRGSIIYAPTFPSIHSKFGPHLKYGTKIPWLHVFFTEKAICGALYKRAMKHPELKLFDWYGGLVNKPSMFRDVRRYKDLNYITNKKMKQAIKNSGLELIDFQVYRSFWLKLIFKIFPFLAKTQLDDILSTGSSFKAQKK